MGLEKRERAIKKSLKEQKVRESRRKSKEWVRALEAQPDRDNEFRKEFRYWRKNGTEI